MEDSVNNATETISQKTTIESAVVANMNMYDALPQARPARQPLNSFQLKQQNEALIARLQQSGLFLNKQTVIQAALIALMEALTAKMGSAILQAAPAEQLPADIDSLPTAPPEVI